MQTLKEFCGRRGSRVPGKSPNDSEISNTPRRVRRRFRRRALSGSMHHYARGFLKAETRLRAQCTIVHWVQKLPKNQHDLCQLTSTPCAGVRHKVIGPRHMVKREKCRLISRSLNVGWDTLVQRCCVLPQRSDATHTGCSTKEPGKTAHVVARN